MASSTKVKHESKFVFRFAKSKKDKANIRSLFGTVRISRSSDIRDTIVFDINLVRFFKMAAVFAVLFYVFAACVLYGWRSTIPQNKISFFDILLPYRWDELGHKEGQTRIAQGLALLEEDNRHKAIFKLRAGISRYPVHTEARYKLADLYAQYGLLDHATILLQRGLEIGFPGREAIELLIGIAQFQQNSGLIVDLADTLLAFPELKEDEELKQTVYRAWVGALVSEERYEEAYELSHRLNADENGPIKAYDIEAYTLTQLGRESEVIPFLETLPSREKVAPEYPVLVVKSHLRMGQVDEALLTLDKLKIDHPVAYQQRAECIMAFFSHGEKDLGLQELNSYLDRFQFNEEALIGITAMLTDLPSSELVQVCLDRAIEVASVNVQTLRFMLVQSYISEGDWKAARDSYEDFLEVIPAEHEDQRYRNWMDALINAILDGGKGGKEGITKVLRSERFEAEVYLESAIAMQRVGSVDIAVDILSMALKHYPYSRQFSSLYDETSEAYNEIRTEREAALRKTIDSLVEEADDTNSEDEQPTKEVLDSVSERIRELTGE